MALLVGFSGACIESSSCKLQQENIPSRYNATWLGVWDGALKHKWRIITVFRDQSEAWPSSVWCNSSAVAWVTLTTLESSRGKARNMKRCMLTTCGPCWQSSLSHFKKLVGLMAPFQQFEKCNNLWHLQWPCPDETSCPPSNYLCQTQQLWIHQLFLLQSSMVPNLGPGLPLIFWCFSAPTKLLYRII